MQGGGGYGAPPGGYGPAPGGYGPPAGAPPGGGGGGGGGGYGQPPPPQQPPGGYGQPPGGGGYGAPPPAPAKKSGVGAWIGIGCGALLLLGIIGGIIGYFVLWAKPAPHLVRYVPKTTTLYVEMPSFKKSLISFATVKPLDSSRVDEKRMMEDTIDAFSTSFDLSPDEAKQVVGGLDSAAFAARDMNDHGKAGGVIAFSSTGAADKLLHTKRFNDKGAFGTGGTRFTLDAKTKGSSAKAGFLEMALDDLHTGTKDRLVWFPKSKLLVLGDEEFVTDVDQVLSGSQESLEKSESYIKAKKTFESGSDVAFFYDTHDLDDLKGAAPKKALDAYLRNRDAFTGTIKIVKAGIMMDMHATLSGSGMPPDDLMPKASKLAFPKRLPADTVAYMAMSTKTKMPGSAVQATLIQRVEDSDPTAAKDLKDGIDAIEKQMGFKVADLIDMTGDEAAMGILLDPSFKLDTSNALTDELGNVGMVYAIAIKDDAKAKMVLGKIKKQLETPGLEDTLKVRSLGGDDFEVDPETHVSFPVPNLTVKYDGHQIIAVLAAGSLTTRALDALQHGKGTLGGDGAHNLAMGALPDDANFYMWVDTGRITSVMLDGASHVRGGVSFDTLLFPDPSTIPVDAVRLTGPDRVTSAMAVRATVKNGVWSIDLDSLNMPALALFSVASELDLGSAIPPGGIFGPGGGSGGGGRRGGTKL